MKRPSLSTAARLREIALAQHGLFTAAQARKAGYKTNNHTYHVESGNWERVGRGLYRLPFLPESPAGQLMKCLLWTQDRAGRIQGVLSHETALSLFEMSDTNPAKVHVTVPAAFRRSAKGPKETVLHYQDLGERQITEEDGLRTTRPLVTILILIDENRLSPELIDQAIRDGLRSGRITASELRKTDMPTEVRARIERLQRKAA